MRIARGILFLSGLAPVLLGPGCAPKPASKPEVVEARPTRETPPPPASSQPAPPSAQVAPPPAPSAACGPSQPDQAGAVRIAALDALLTQALKDATARHQTLGPIVLAEESRMGPGGQVFLHDTSPEIVEHFSGHTPPVDNYSTAFKMENGHTVRNDPNAMTFTTADICWLEPTRATVRARQLSPGVNRLYVAALEKKGATWTVTGIGSR
jgi:hypothetical protein